MESTQIEPSVQYGDQYLQITRQNADQYREPATPLSLERLPGEGTGWGSVACCGGGYQAMCIGRLCRTAFSARLDTLGV